MSASSTVQACSVLMMSLNVQNGVTVLYTSAFVFPQLG